MDYKIITVTPAGRYRYMQILHRYLMRNRHIIDQHIWWQNTTNREDVAYMEHLAERFPYFYSVQKPVSPVTSPDTHSIHPFFTTACDPDAIYIRLDDDICWMDRDALEKLIVCRIDNPDPFLVYGNIINNALCNYIHRQNGAIPNTGTLTWDCECPFSWGDPGNSRLFHTSFFEHLNEGTLDKYKFGNFTLSNYDRFSINVVSWFGRDFTEFGGVVDRYEEIFLSHTKPCELNRPCLIAGSALFVHFAFYTQRDFLEQKSNCLQLYDELAKDTSVPG